MNVLEVASGLRRWTALHPDWTSEEGGPEGWEREVGSISYDSGDELVLIDPLVPAEDEERFWTSLDRDVERAGGAVHVLLTLFWHARSANRMLERYGARVWAHEPARDLVAERTRYTDLFRAGEMLTGGVQARDAGRAWEVVFWIPTHRALVTGDVIHGTGEGLRLLPDSWLGKANRDAFFAAMRALLDLPVERVLTAHGEPVLTAGHAALARALER